MKSSRLRPQCERQKAILMTFAKRLKADLRAHEMYGLMADHLTVATWLQDVTVTLGKVTGR